VRRATALIDRALAMDMSQYADWAYAYFMFAKAIAEYRAGRFEGAITILGTDAGKVLPPAPDLVLAMALARLGRNAEALASLQAAIPLFDQDVSIAGEREAWMFHILRREAEAVLAASPGDSSAGPTPP
jgi:serine/threonine-protein kinase